MSLTQTLKERTNLKNDVCNGDLFKIYKIEDRLLFDLSYWTID